jgi:hypothetical protein
MQRDPNLAKAFDNLAGLFAPPSGADFVASAAAQAKRQEIEQQAELWRLSADPNADKRVFDQRAVALGRGSIANGFYGVDTQAATARSNNAADNARALQQTGMQQSGETTRAMLAPVGQGATRFNPPGIQQFFDVPPTQIGVVEVNPGQRAVLPDNRVIDGAPKPMSVDELNAQVTQDLLKTNQLTPQQVYDLARGGAPVTTRGADGKTRYSSGTEAARTGATPADTDAPARADNFVAMGTDGKSFNFFGYARNGPNGLEIINQATGQPQPNVIRREGSQGGMSFESDGKGGIKLSTGNAAGQPTGRVNDLMRAESEGNRAVNELIPLLENLRQDDLGAAGNINDLMTNYGAQVAPGLARPDVTGRRNQLRATTLSLAKALLGDDRLSDADRRAAEQVSVSNGIDESLPGAQAKISSLIVLNAYRAEYAKSVREGQKLPPLSPQIVGQMVDKKLIPLNVAEMYVKNNFTAREPTTGPIPGVQTPQLPGAAGAAAPPAGRARIISSEPIQ